MLSQNLVFSLRGSLLSPSGGGIPTFLRRSPAYAERDEPDRGLVLLQHGVHHPRYVDGDLQLEQSATNLVPSALDLSRSSWVKGSSILIQSDRVQGLDGNYLADRVVVSQMSGNNTNAQRLYRDLVLPPGTLYTATWYLRLAGGRLGANDRVEVLNEVVGEAQQAALAPLLNLRPGHYVPVSISFTTTGSSTGDTPDPARTVRLQLYCETSVSLDWGGIQVEAGPVRTSFIPTRGAVAARAADELRYPLSPFEGLSHFTCWLHLVRWRGDGPVYQAGDFSLAIENGRLRVRCGSSSLLTSQPLPGEAQIAVVVSESLGQMRIYINGRLVSTGALVGYRNAAGPAAVGGAPHLQIRSLYGFNTALSDGGIGVGETVGGEIQQLYETSTELVASVSSRATLVLPAVEIPRNKGRAAIRFPQYRYAAQTIQSLQAGSGAAAQVVRIQVDRIVSSSASQTEWVRINSSLFTFTSDETPTKAEIAAGLRAAISNGPEPVTTAYTSNNDFFTVTARTAGDGFWVEVSPNLSFTVTTQNQLAVNRLTVNAGAADYQVGLAQIQRNYALVTDVVITSIDPVANHLFFYTQPGSNYQLIQVGDVVFQPSWQTEVGPTNYVADHLEGYPDVKVVVKSTDGFVLINENPLLNRLVTPTATLAL